MAPTQFNYHVSVRRRKDGRTVVSERQGSGLHTGVSGVLLALGAGLTLAALLLSLTLAALAGGVVLTTAAVLHIARRALGRKACPPAQNHGTLSGTPERPTNATPEEKVVEAEFRMLDDDRLG